MFQVQNLIHSGFAGEQDRGRLLLLAGLLLIDLSRGGCTTLNWSHKKVLDKNALFISKTYRNRRGSGW